MVASIGNLRYNAKKYLFWWQWMYFNCCRLCWDNVETDIST